MSDLTPCNYCTLQRITRRRLRPGWILTVLPGGVRPYGAEAFIHPDTVTIVRNAPHAARDRERYFVAGFGELTDHCVC
jgi:hypothetical protein